MTWLSPAASSASRRIVGARGLCLPTIACRNKHAANLTQRFITGARPRDPLRVLFCGSDSFSQKSLDALIKEHISNPDLIQSIDVAVRPLKPVGRGMKQLAPKGPMHILAEQHQLPLHEIETFTGWNLPEYDLPINLIIAVSFGLFVPPRVLRSAQFGGLNVHPSLLPDLRGPAPIHHALLARDTHTGVSLQTLSDKTFDAGAVLLQTPLPGIPIDPSWDVEALTQRLAVVGSEMLIQGLRQGLYILPHVDVSRRSGSSVAVPGGFQPRHAPKLEKFDYQIQWDSWTASDAAIRSTKLHEKLWTTAIDKKGKSQRWTMEGVEEIQTKDSSEMRAIEQGFKKLQQTAAYRQQPTVNILEFQQTLHRPPPKRTKKHSIFNSPTETTLPKSDAPTTTTSSSSPETLTRDPSTKTLTIRKAYFPSSIDDNTESILIFHKGQFLRIAKITVEGKPTRPAALVAEQYKRTVSVQQLMELAASDEKHKNSIPYNLLKLGDWLWGRG
ncbi:Methionyl-tRNA formyltransferase [Rhypophila sp. PSN 637]